MTLKPPQIERYNVFTKIKNLFDKGIFDYNNILYHPVVCVDPNKAVTIDNFHYLIK
jgi:hypothetical protein